MTKLSPEARALVAIAGKAWVAHKVGRHTAEAEIRARVAAEQMEVERRSALNVSETLHRAIAGGATQAALREVTTKDFRTFKRHLEFDGFGPLP